jgi:single-stranded-DNA-specific exonuclease
MQVLITDHHLPGAELPAAEVIVNPNVRGSTFGSRALAGVGVAFYVMAAVRREIDARGVVAMPPVTDFLDLVALGTVADLVPLDVNNRVLVSQGIRRIRAGRGVAGIRALLAIANRNVPSLTAADLGFAIGPRLNAAGRLDDMSIGIRCLLTDSDSEALALATRLDQLNTERREIEARMQGAALAAVSGLGDVGSEGSRHGVCLFDASWHQGVVGLVASRIKDRVRRPVIAFARNADGTLRGSARSVPGVHIRDVLDGIAARHPELISRFGGHAMAAGLSLEERHLDAFARAFDEEVARWSDPSIPANRVETDGELASDEIALETAQALRDGGPWGQAFPEPCFDGVFAIKNARMVSDKHLKMWVTTADQSRAFDAIAFNFKSAESSPALPVGEVRLVYRLDINEYKGERRLQLLVDHVLR